MHFRNCQLIFLACGILPCTGCSLAPTIDIAGSFFPAWMLCLAMGIVMTGGLRWLLLRQGVESEIGMGTLTVVYPGLAIFFACSLWLVLFR